MKQKRRLAEARGLRELGHIEEAEAQYDKALAAYLQALHIYQELAHQQGVAQVLKHISWIYLRQGKYTAAIEASKQALVLARSLQVAQLTGEILGNLGRMYNLQGDFAAALGVLQESLQIARQLNNRKSESTTLSGIGLVYQYQGRYEPAIAAFQESLQHHQKLGDRRGEALVLGNLGNVYQYLGRLDEAVDCYTQAMQINQQVSAHRGFGINQGNLGDVLLRQQKFVDAQSALEAAIAICAPIFPIGADAFRGSLALLHTAKGEYELAKQVLQTVSPHIEVDPEEYGKFLCKRAQVYWCMREREATREDLRKVEDIVYQLKSSKESELGKLQAAAQRALIKGVVQLD